MNGIGKAIIAIGLVQVVVGALAMLAARFGLPLGKLPGDISYRGKNFSFYFPLGTSILISVVLSAILYLVFAIAAIRTSWQQTARGSVQTHRSPTRRLIRKSVGCQGWG